MKVLVSDGIDKQGAELLKAAGLTVDEKIGLKPEELVKVIPEYDAIIVRSATKVTKEVIDAGKNLKAIGRAGVGLDNVDSVAAKARNIKVMNTPAATSVTVAELALGLMLSCARSIPQATQSLKEGKWEKKAFKGFELFGKTLGLIGVGRIGTELAKRAKAMGMKVIAYDPFVKTHEIAEITGLDDVLAQSDFISLHLPKTEQSKHMLGKEQFAKMKPTAVLVNCARGGVVEENALYEALNTGKLKAAALDVFETEPVDKTPEAKEFYARLFKLTNFIGTPHVGAQTAEGQRRAGIGIAEAVRDALKE
jgi:D-3-phosphoglycerate dehydrogenase